MTALLLAPHNDDETLFAAYTILRYKPHVVVCTAAYLQQLRGETTATYADRAVETARALALLDATSWQQLAVRDDNPDWDMLERCLVQVDAEQAWDTVLVPEWEEGGHEHHNIVHDVAKKVFDGRCVGYMTYRRGHERSKGVEVAAEQGWASRKFAAMACYQSQIDMESTRPWFNKWDREWVAP